MSLDAYFIAQSIDNEDFYLHYTTKDNYFFAKGLHGAAGFHKQEAQTMISDLGLPNLFLKKMVAPKVVPVCSLQQIDNIIANSRNKMHAKKKAYRARRKQRALEKKEP